MMGTIFQVALQRLWNNKQELLLALIVPIMFFSIFALIFGRGIGSDTPPIAVIVIDEDKSPLTEEIATRMREHSSVRLEETPSEEREGSDHHEDTARDLIQQHGADLVVCFPVGMEQDVLSRTPVRLQMYSEGSNPVGRQIVSSLLTESVGSAAGTQPNEPSAGTIDDPRASEAATERSTSSPQADDTSDQPAALIEIEASDVFAAGKRSPKIAMYAAGIAVMFLLFSASGAGGSLLEEYEAGTLDRLLTSRLTVTQLLAGKWLFITALGCVQLTVMFAWAQFAFGVDWLGHLGGFAVLTLCTAAATASLALCLAACCRSRAQLNGISIVLILTMSALGGSMVPRYIMSDQMQKWGRITFNAWALDGFKKVFWYELPVSAISTELGVLVAMAVSLACLARIFANRWAAH